MTVTTVFATAPGGTGSVRSNNAAYATARTGGTVSATSKHGVGQMLSGDYYCWETFVIFDTGAALPDSDEISAVTLSLDGSNNQSTTDFIAGVAASSYDGGSTVAGDWVSGAAIPTPELATWNSSGYSATYNAFTETADFKNAINKTGNTSLIVYSQRHRDGTAPPDSEQVDFEDADAAGTTVDPKLDITHAAAGFTSTIAMALPMLVMAATSAMTIAGTIAMALPMLSMSATASQAVANTGRGRALIAAAG